MTSSPGPTPAASRPRCSAEVPVLVASTCRLPSPRYFAMPASKAWVIAPMPSQPACSASTTDLMVSTPMCGWNTGIGGRVGSVTGAPEIAVGRAGEQELAVDARVDLEAARGLEELPHGGLGIVALAPRPSREQLVGEVLDQRVEDDQIAVPRHQRRVQLELAQHVVVRVVGVEHDH